MRRSSSYLIALLILVIVVALLGIIVLQRRAPDDLPPAATPTPETVETPPAAAPTPALPETTETLPPTEPPVFETREPLETEEPDPEETEPQPEFSVQDASGTLTSDTGTGLNIVADWQTFTDADGSAKLRVNVSVVSYSFFTSSLYQSITLTVDGTEYCADSPAVSYDGSESITTPMASFVVDAPASGTLISAVWNYRGSYSGKQLDAIRADGFVIY